MASGDRPSADNLWPKLRRRIKECKSRKAKSKFNAYASQGLEKFSVVYAELQARRDSVVERIGAPVEMVRSMSKSRSRPSVLPNIKSDIAAKDVAVVSTDHQCEEISKSDTGDASTSSVQSHNVENVNSVRLSQGRDRACTSAEMVESVKETIDLDEYSVQMDQGGADDVEFVYNREIPLHYSFGGLEMRGRKGALRSRRRSLCGRERKWRQVNRTAVTFVVILGAMAEKSADMAGSILAALLLGVVSHCRRGNQHFCRLLSDIIKHLQGHLHAYLSGLASKNLDFGHGRSNIDEGKACCITDSDCLSNSTQLKSSSADEASHSPGLDQAPVTSRLASCSRTVSPVVSDPASNGRSPTSASVEWCLSPSNKLNQFKTKMFKSFSQNKSARDIRSHRASSMPPISTSCEDFQNQESCLGSRSERWSSNPANSAAEGDLGVIRCSSPPARVVKKKSFLQRRSTLLRNDDEFGSDSSDVRSSSFSRSRFGSLRISISHSHHDDFGTTTSSTPDSSRSLRIGSLRITTSMKESPRRSVDFTTSSKKPCVSTSPGDMNQRANTSAASKIERIATPRQSGLSVASCSPYFPPNLECRIREMKKRHKYEAFLVVIFLVALLFLVAGRAPAVLATSISVMFLCQLDKFQQSGGAGWDTDASRRTISVSRKLRTSESTYFSPRTPCPPCMGGNSISMTPTPICRRSICMGQFFGRTKRP